MPVYGKIFASEYLPGLFLLLVLTLSALSMPATAFARTDYSGVYFVGHAIPDTDSIGSAIGAAELFGGIAVRQGQLNGESEFALNYFGVARPPAITDFSDYAVFLLDHNQRPQSVLSIKDAYVVGIIDHHALRETAFVTERPIWIDIRPWGSTCTIIAAHFEGMGVQPSREAAGMLLSGILSDTLIFTSPTTSENDRHAVGWLATLAEVEDIHAFGRALLDAKSNLTNLSDQEVLLSDFKQYELGGKSVGFGTVETVQPEMTLERRQGLLNEMVKLKQERGYDLLFLTIVDVLKRRSHLLVPGIDEQAVANQAFSVQGSNQVLTLPGIVSRKNQLIPRLQSFLGDD